MASALTMTVVILKRYPECLNNMAKCITGTICDGNHGCVMKGVSAVDTAFVQNFAMAGICIENLHGINGSTPETM